MISVAIDGPAGVGKSTASKEIAKKLGFTYVDTGAFYRAIALYVIENRISLVNNIEPYLNKINIVPRLVNEERKIFLNGEDVTLKIRSEEVSIMASKVASISAVRFFLLDFQREFSLLYNVVMDGRDIGTVVLPKASVKIFLTAKDEIRAKRRYKELIAKNQDISYNRVLAEIKERDLKDFTRKNSPLKVADDAIVIDNSNYDLDQTINIIYEIICQKLKEKNNETK